MLSSLRNIRFASPKPTIFIAPLFRCQMFVAVNAMAMTVADVVAASHPVCKSTSLVLGWLSSHTSYTYMLHHTLDDATSAHECYSFPTLRTFMSKDHFHSIWLRTDRMKFASVTAQTNPNHVISSGK